MVNFIVTFVFQNIGTFLEETSRNFLCWLPSDIPARSVLRVLPGLVSASRGSGSASGFLFDLQELALSNKTRVDEARAVCIYSF